LPKFACELGISIQHNVLGEAMMLEHMREEQPPHLLGHGTFLGGNEVCHLAKSIHHHPMIASNPLNGGKLTMKSMDTLSHNPLGINKGHNNHICFLLNVRFC